MASQVSSFNQPQVQPQAEAEELNSKGGSSVSEIVAIATAIILTVGALVALTILFPQEMLAVVTVIGAAAGAVLSVFVYLLGVLKTGH